MISARLQQHPTVTKQHFHQLSCWVPNFRMKPLWFRGQAAFQLFGWKGQVNQPSTSVWMFPIITGAIRDGMRWSDDVTFVQKLAAVCLKCQQQPDLHTNVSPLTTLLLAVAQKDSIHPRAEHTPTVVCLLFKGSAAVKVTADCLKCY